MVALAPQPLYIWRMSTSETYPYALEILPCEKPAGHYSWTIRERGKLLERSMGPAPSREEAERSGMKAIDRILTQSRQPRGRGR
jgi:hypothetical protein